MRKITIHFFISLWAMLFVFQADSMAQPNISSAQDVKMKYVYTLEEALKLAKEQNKLIFFNCFMDWAGPCHGMNKKVFNNQEFCDYMNSTFINLFMNMQTLEGQKLAKKYGVLSYAHYLVLDADGNLVHRISGGADVKQFKEKVALALNPSTSWGGARAIIEKGNYTRKDMYNYLVTLDVAGEYALFRKLAKEYIASLNPEDFTRKENWIFIKQAIPNRESPCYDYLLKNRSLFLKEIDKAQIDHVVESVLFPEINSLAMGDLPYDTKRMEMLYMEMQQAELPDSCTTRVYYDIAKLRGERKYLEMIAYIRANKSRLSLYRLNLEMSLNLSGLTKEEKKELIAYLKSSAEEVQGKSAKRNLLDMVAQLEKEEGQGIIFDKSSFKDLLEKAKKEDKILFLDCFTVWCGPCRMMANTVFTDTRVGEIFNSHFINAKIDMEKGEGIELAKDYNVTAYPTMLFIDGDGKVISRITGAKNVETLLKLAQDVLN